MLTYQCYFGLPSVTDLPYAISTDTSAWLFGVKW